MIYTFNMRFSLFIILSMALWSVSFAQEESQSNNLISNIIEDFLESTDAENFDYNTILENLNYYFEKPVNINSATEQEFRDMYLLNEIQIANFMTYRIQFGNFLSIYELQAIPSWDLATIKNVTPFLKCEIAASDFNLDFKDALKNGTSTLFIKGKRVLEDRKGFQKDGNGQAPYLGDPNHLYVRYRYEFGQLFKAGFTLEKDPGEQLFSGASKYGFDFNSFFLCPKYQ
ncbi:MAG: helix-hairpin-helix domain-containing protein [Saprospiraceae bacterium]|nr:helix-hairpin-helix domain-containing protein [Saprospiraceae bacterium]